MFNKASLSFIKIKNALNKDELFNYGYLLGMRTAFVNTVKKNIEGISEEDAEAVVNDILTIEQLKAAWDQMAITFELDVRGFDELLEVTN